MGAPLRRSSSSLKEKLYANPYAFDFLQAVRVLTHLKEGAAPLGRTNKPEKESVRFVSTTSFAFQASDLASLNINTYGPPKLTVNFLGIAGVQAPLPAPYVQYIIDRNRLHDYALRDFLDIFNHRFVSLLYRIKIEYSIGTFEIPAEETSIGKILRSLAGLGYETSILKDRLSVPDRALLSFVNLLWTAPRSKAGLVQILHSYFKVPVHILDFQGRWIKIPKNKQSALGVTTLGRYNKLGKSMILGNNIWDKVGHFTIRLGPLNLQQFKSFLKTGAAYKSLCELVTFYIGFDKTFDFNLVIKKDEIPQIALGNSSVLAWQSWLKTNPSPDDDAQVYIHPQSEEYFD